MGDKTKKEVGFEGIMELPKVIDYFENVLKGLKAGTIHLQRGFESVTLRPESAISVEVEAKQRIDKESIEMKLKWKKEPSLHVDESTLLEIRANDPASVSK